jgi:hypothetical protein
MNTVVVRRGLLEWKMGQLKAAERDMLVSQQGPGFISAIASIMFARFGAGIGEQGARLRVT